MDGEDARGWEDVPRASGAVIFLNDTAYESGEFQAVHDPLPVADWIAAMRRGGFGVSVMPDAALELEGGPYAGGTVVETEMMGGRCYFVVPPEALDWLEHVLSEQEYRQMRADVTPAVGSYAGMAADVPVSAAADWAPEASRVATVLYLDPVPLWDCRRLGGQNSARRYARHVARGRAAPPGRPLSGWAGGHRRRRGQALLCRSNDGAGHRRGSSPCE